MPRHDKSALFGCADCGLNPPDLKDPLPMVAGACRGGWSRVDNEMHYCWPFIATDFDRKQLDGTIGIHRPGKCVYGLLWLDKPLGPESDHSSLWHRDRTTKTKYRCPVCHAAKTAAENKRRLYKHAGIERSPTAPLEVEDASSTYDVDTEARGRSYTELPWTPQDITFIEMHFAPDTAALVHPHTSKALTCAELRQLMIEAKLPNARLRTVNQLQCKCTAMRQLIEDGRYKYGQRLRGSGQAGAFSAEEAAFVDDHMDVLTAPELLTRMKDTFPESEKRTLASVKSRIARMRKKNSGVKKKNSGGGGSSSSTAAASRRGSTLREIRLRMRRSWRTKTTRLR